MKKIVTAINNPTLNEELKKEKFIEVIGKDIQYKEAILELLENNKEIDIIIINERMPGEINFLELIKKIKFINKRIKIIIILEKENNYLENNLRNLNINDIYLNKKINLEKLIEIIKEKEINKEEELKNEIERLKKIIEEKNKKNRNIIFKKTKNYIVKKLSNKKGIKIKKNNNAKIITFSGYPGTGKTTTALVLGFLLGKENSKVLFIDMDLKNKSIEKILHSKINTIKTKKRKNNFEKIKLLMKNRILKNNFEKEKLKNKNVTSIIFKIKNFNKKIINKLKYKNLKLKNIKNKKLILKKYNKKIKYKNNKKEKIINKINLIKIKINKKIFLLNNIEIFYKNNKKNNHEYKKNKFKKLGRKNFENEKNILNNNIKILLERYKKYFNFIIIDLGYFNKDKTNKEILKNSDLNFIIGTPNILGIQELEKTVKKYTNEYKIQENKINIILNKYTMYSIEKEIIKKFFKNIKHIYKINHEKNYENYINTNFKTTKYLINKKIKNNFKLIIKNINK